MDQILSPTFSNFRDVSYFVPFVELCAKFGGGTKYFEKILNANLFNLISEETFLIEACQQGSEFVPLASHKFLEMIASKGYVLDEWNSVNLLKAMKLLLENYMSHYNRYENDEQKNRDAKTTLNFAFLFGSDVEFKSILDFGEWSEEDLLDLFRNTFLDPLSERAKNVFHVLFNRLNSNTKIFLKDVEKFLIQVSIESFTMLWNDVRLVKTQGSIHHFLFEKICWLSEDILNFLMPKCLMSSEWEFEFKDKSKIKTEFRNCCWLKFIETPMITTLFVEMNERLKLKWTEELFAWSLKSISLGNTLFLFHISEIEKSWWTPSRIHHSILVRSCSEADHNVFMLLKHFPNINFSENNNEALRSLLKDRKPERDISGIWAKLSSRIKFKNEKERDEMVKLANSIDQFSQYADEISEIEIIK